MRDYTGTYWVRYSCLYGTCIPTVEKLKSTVPVRRKIVIWCTLYLDVGYEVLLCYHKIILLPSEASITTSAIIFVLSANGLHTKLYIQYPCTSTNIPVREDCNVLYFR